MSLRSNFARFLASLRRCRADATRGKWQYRWRCFRTALTRPRNGDLNDDNIDRSFTSATTTFSRSPRVKIREPQTIGPADDEDEGELRNGSVLEEARETVLILARIVIVSSVVTTLIAAYLITRLTHTNLFPTALRRGKRKIVFIKYYPQLVIIAKRSRQTNKITNIISNISNCEHDVKTSVKIYNINLYTFFAQK